MELEIPGDYRKKSVNVVSWGTYITISLSYSYIENELLLNSILSQIAMIYH